MFYRIVWKKTNPRRKAVNTIQCINDRYSYYKPLLSPRGFLVIYIKVIMYNIYLIVPTCVLYQLNCDKLD